ncbi:MAG: metal ABC transporter substrate-binding protein [Lachnotalea sp.]
MKNKIIPLICVTTLIVTLVGCGQNSINTQMHSTTESSVAESVAETEVTSDQDKLKVVTTLYPYYDFVRQIAGDKVNITMLVPAGMDTHSFEPTPADMIVVQNAEVFIYNGGDMESWVPQVLDAVENTNQISDCMMDHVETFVEEECEGMEPEEDETEATDVDDTDQTTGEDVEYDEHIWTSPVNAQKIVTEICNVLKEADQEDADYFQSNADNYIKQLQDLDSQFKDVVDNSKRKIIIFGDKFPLRYFVEEYGLEYRAAFNGCSTETEPSVSMVAYLIDKVKEENVPVIYHIELSSGKIADTISEATGAKVLLFHTCHNVSQEDFDNGVTYLELMQKNVEALREGLN